MMRFAFAIVVAAVSFALAEPTVRLWPESGMPFAPRDGAVPPETVSAKGIVSNVSSPEIEVFLPTNGAKVTMGVVICPGGAYGCLDYER